VGGPLQVTSAAEVSPRDHEGRKAMRATDHW